MKILLEHLRTFIDMPERLHDARELLDDVGIEVKTAETSSLGTVFNVELLANRGDHYCYAGIAREVSGRTGGRLPDNWTVTLPKVTVPEQVAVIAADNDEMICSLCFPPLSSVIINDHQRGYEAALARHVTVAHRAERRFAGRLREILLREGRIEIFGGPVS